MFAGLVVAVVDGVADVLACFGELLGGRGGWLGVEQVGEFGAAVSSSPAYAYP